MEAYGNPNTDEYGQPPVSREEGVVSAFAVRPAYKRPATNEIMSVLRERKAEAYAETHSVPPEPQQSNEPAGMQHQPPLYDERQTANIQQPPTNTDGHTAETINGLRPITRAEIPHAEPAREQKPTPRADPLIVYPITHDEIPHSEPAPAPQPVQTAPQQPLYTDRQTTTEPLKECHAAPRGITEKQLRALSRRHLLLMIRDLEKELRQAKGEMELLRLAYLAGAAHADKGECNE